MLYLVLKPVTLVGVAYEPGDVLDLGDLEQATQMLRVARGAVVEAKDAPLAPLRFPVERVAAVPLPQPELRTVAPPKPPKGKRS